MPTTNPVPSADPSDLVFNAGTFDRVVNGEAPDFTDRFGRVKKTVAGSISQVQAAAEQALAVDIPAAIGTVAAINSRGNWASGTAYAIKDIVLTGGTWYICIAAHTSGASFATDEASKWRVYQGLTTGDLGYQVAEVQDVLDSAKPMANYTALRAYTGRATAVRITTPGIAGVFQRDADTTTADNGGTVIVDGAGRRWKRLFDGVLSPGWFDVKGGLITDESLKLQSALNHSSSSGIAIDLADMEILCRDVNIPSCTIISNGARLLGSVRMSAPGAETWIARITGNGVKIFGELVIDGNKAEYASNPDGAHYDFYSKSTSGHEIDHIKCVNAVKVGFVFDLVDDFVIKKHEVTHANRTGALFQRCKKFDVLEYNYFSNGYGFGGSRSGNSDASYDPIGWGCSVGYVCSDFRFLNGRAVFNGRDGLGVGNGSYDGRIAGLAAWNGDGGFTLYADDTTPSFPGNNQGPRNIDYDIVSHSNRGCGVVGYAPVDTITVVGKVYNSNVIAGQRAFFDGANHGVFIPRGSKNVKVDVHAFDTRPTGTVTSLASPVFGVSGWTAGTLDDYPYVEIITAAGVTRGYAKVTAESGGLTLESAPINGVILADIVVGDTITAATQRSGVFVGEECSGDVKSKGPSTRPGYLPVQLTTNALSGGVIGYGGNVDVYKNVTGQKNWLVNPDFDADTAGASPAGWALSPGTGGTWSAVNTGELFGVNAVQIVAGSTSAFAQASGQVSAQVKPGFVKASAGSYAVFSCRTFCSDVADMSIRIVIETTTGVFLEYRANPVKTGRGNAVVTCYVPENALNVFFRVWTAAGKTVRFGDCKIYTFTP